MPLAVILMIISAIMFFNAISTNPEYITHQILQELLFLSSIIALGFAGIIYYLENIVNKMNDKDKSE
ncbi:MAG: hypothetical protein NC200_06115 [Candidatus Gastranaerophilales bacterium]|nr:hypothetical protein [Candidatus Gastranaerophilales bacterium]